MEPARVIIHIAEKVGAYFEAGRRRQLKEGSVEPRAGYDEGKFESERVEHVPISLVAILYVKKYVEGR